MKDIQGVQRGKCNSCDCQEYITPSTHGKVKCEYCNHTPREHDKLGKCRKCGGCEEYYSEDSSDCHYCGCAASDHNVGQSTSDQRSVEKSMQHGPSTDLPSTYLHQEMSYSSRYGHFDQREVSTDSPSFATARFQQHQGPPKMYTPGREVRSHGTNPGMQYGNCIYPGCPFPKYVDKEEGKIHDFCSKSCAKNFAEMQASFHKYKMTQQIGPGSKGTPQSGSLRHGQGSAPLLISQPIRPPNSQSHVTPSSSHSSGPGVRKMCSKCGRNQANPGRGWCQQCYISSRT